MKEKIKLLYAKLLKQLSINLFVVSDATKDWAVSLCRKYRQIVYPPTHLQYLNRLIEHYEGESLWAAAHHYARLVDSGLTPETAFKLVTE